MDAIQTILNEKISQALTHESLTFSKPHMKSFQAGILHFYRTFVRAIFPAFLLSFLLVGSGAKQLAGRWCMARAFALQQRSCRCRHRKQNLLCNHV